MSLNILVHFAMGDARLSSFMAESCSIVVNATFSLSGHLLVDILIHSGLSLWVCSGGPHTVVQAPCELSLEPGPVMAGPCVSGAEAR